MSEKSKRELVAEARRYVENEQGTPGELAPVNNLIERLADALEEKLEVTEVVQ